MSGLGMGTSWVARWALWALLGLGVSTSYVGGSNHARTARTGYGYFLRGMRIGGQYPCPDWVWGLLGVQEWIEQLYDEACSGGCIEYGSEFRLYC